LAAVLKQGGGTAVLRLQPEHLGQLRIEVTIEADRVSARMEASSDAARELLMDSKETLRSALEARGLSVERIEVETVRRQDDAGGEPPAEYGGFDAGQGGAGGDRHEAPGRALHPGLGGDAAAPGDVLLWSPSGAVSFGPDAQDVYRLRLDAVA